MGDAQRASGLPAPDEVCEPFFNRPFISVRASVEEAVLADIRDPLVRRLPVGVGSIEQWVDNVDVLVDPVRRQAVTQVWRGLVSRRDDG